MLIQAHKEKDRAPYEFNAGERHRRVLHALRNASNGMTDAELTFSTMLHMAAARRCELRDAGAIRRAGRYGASWRWKLTDKGQALLSRIEHPSAAPLRDAISLDELVAVPA